MSASPGITVGRAFVLEPAGARTQVEIPAEQRPGEAERAMQALRLAADDLERLALELRSDGRGNEAAIVETGVLMALDPELAARIESLIQEMGFDPSDALRDASDQVALELSRLGDPTLAQRADDVRSIGRRAAGHLRESSVRVSEGVLIADSLGPADVAELAPKVKGIALAAGGITSHAAIVARALGLPMVVGAGAELLEVEDGEEVLVDGDRGVVLRRPDAEHAAWARHDAEQRRAARELAIARRREPAQTKDGHRVSVLANASTVAELEEAVRQGAEGVGLLRTELLFLEANAWPSFEEQVKVLRPVLSRLAGQTATVRLFDFGGDKTPPFLRGVSARGIEVLLENPEMLRTHLRAVLAAAGRAQLRILVPMVSDAEQLREVRRAAGTDALVGAMVETPEAAKAALEIAESSDFLSLGTNDLTQLVLGLDREHSRSAPVLDPRVLAHIAATVRAGHEVGIPVDVCGEAASDPRSLSVMVGLGVDELSVAPARVGQVREWIRGLAYEDSQKEGEALLHQAGQAGGQRG